MLVQLWWEREREEEELADRMPSREGRLARGLEAALLW